MGTIASSLLFPGHHCWLLYKMELFCDSRSRTRTHTLACFLDVVVVAALDYKNGKKSLSGIKLELVAAGTHDDAHQRENYSTTHGKLTSFFRK